MKPVSLKTIISRAFAEAPITSTGKWELEPCFLTPMGFVFGNTSKPPLKNLNENIPKETTHELVRVCEDELLEILKKEPDAEQAHKDGCIVLENVRIEPFGAGTTVNLDTLVLFTDNILGVYLYNPLKPA